MARLTQEALNKLPRDEAQRYFVDWATDLTAKRILNALAESIYVGPGDTEVNAAVASMIHAVDYLTDRIGYEMAPHPKGMIRLPEEISNV